MPDRGDGVWRFFDEFEDDAAKHNHGQEIDVYAALLSAACDSLRRG